MRANRRGWLRALAPPLLLTAALLAPLGARAQRVMVFPLTQAEGPTSAQWLGTGLSVAVHDALVVSGVLTIPVEDLRAYYDQEGLVSEPRFSVPAQVALARQLGAGTLVTGTYAVSGGSVSVRLQALSASGDLRRLGRWDEGAGLKELLSLTRRLRDHLLGVLGSASRPDAPVGPEAFEAYIRGRIAPDPTLQEVYLRKAVELQPDYDDASCYLAVVLLESDRVTEARAILEKLRDHTYAKAYLGRVALGNLRLEEGALADARGLFLSSLKQAENPEAHLGLARLLLRQRRLDEASRELRVAERFGTHQDDVDALRAELKRLQEAASRPVPEAPAPPAP